MEIEYMCYLFAIKNVNVDHFEKQDVKDLRYIGDIWVLSDVDLLKAPECGGGREEEAKRRGVKEKVKRRGRSRERHREDSLSFSFCLLSASSCDPVSIDQSPFLHSKFPLWLAQWGSHDLGLLPSSLPLWQEKAIWQGYRDLQVQNLRGSTRPPIDNNAPRFIKPESFNLKKTRFLWFKMSQNSIYLPFLKNFIFRKPMAREVCS